MNKFKKLNGSWQAFLAVTMVMVLAGTLVLLAAEKPESGYLGVSVQSLSRAEREKLGVKNGVEVLSVEKESAAAKAGIKEDDIIQLVNGEKIRDPQDLVEIIAELAPSAAIKINLWRDGKALEKTAALGKREQTKNFTWSREKLPPIFRSAGYLGIVLQELTADLASYFNVNPGAGVLIVRVEKDTPAEKAGLKAGDVIVQMGEKAVKDADAVLVMTCGAGVQTVAEATDVPTFPGLESAFLGNVVRHGVFEERCSMCGDCVLDQTAGICPVTTCPKGLLNGPCGGMWKGKCEVLHDRDCTFVQINRRLAHQRRGLATRIVPPKDFSKHLKPGSVDMRHARPKQSKGTRAEAAPAETSGASKSAAHQAGAASGGAEGERP